MTNKIDREIFLNRYPNLINIFPTIDNAIDEIVHRFQKKGKLLVCGNGGSASDAQHIVAELQKDFLIKRFLKEKDKSRFNEVEDRIYLCQNLRYGCAAISLVSENSLITAISNDSSYDISFAQQVWALGTCNDVFLGISTSGNSRNVVLAAQVAKAIGMKTIGLAGAYPETRLQKYSDFYINVPEVETYKVQELHLPLYHYLCQQIEKNLVG